MIKNNTRVAKSALASSWTGITPVYERSIDSDVYKPYTGVDVRLISLDRRTRLYKILKIHQKSFALGEIFLGVRIDGQWTFSFFNSSKVIKISHQRLLQIGEQVDGSLIQAA